MTEKYSTEKQGQIDFFNDYLKLVDKNLILDDILNDNTDGVINGNILEFKLKINSLNEVLFQTIKYLSSMRIKGKSIPKNILLISLNDSKIYLYETSDYLNDIEKVYIGSASKNNTKFIAQKALKTLNYKENNLDYIIIDTAGRLQIDENLVEELKNINQEVNPQTLNLNQTGYNINNSFYPVCICFDITNAKYFIC